MLDIDTGGERLFALGRQVSPWPAKVAATESFQPNIVLARRRLNGLAVEVVSYTRPGRLPFGDREFELIINRHGRYSPREIRRILQPGGTFITEQVGSDMCTTLNRLLDAPGEATTRWDLRTASREMTEAGFTLLREQEHHGRDLFVDIGAIAWYLIKVRWQVSIFAVDEYFQRLHEIHQMIQKTGPIDAGSHHFLIVARLGTR